MQISNNEAAEDAAEDDRMQRQFIERRDAKHLEDPHYWPIEEDEETDERRN